MQQTRPFWGGWPVFRGFCCNDPVHLCNRRPHRLHYGRAENGRCRGFDWLVATALRSFGPRRPIPFRACLSNGGFRHTSLAWIRLIPIASMKPSPNLAAIRSYGVRFPFDPLARRGRTWSPKTGKRRKKEGQGGRTVAITQSSNTQNGAHQCTHPVGGLR